MSLALTPDEQQRIADILHQRALQDRPLAERFREAHVVLLLDPYRASAAEACMNVGLEGCPDDQMAAAAFEVVGAIVGREQQWLPNYVRDAIDALAQYTVSAYADKLPEGVTVEQLRAQVTGAVQAQVEDPDFEQASEITIEKEMAR
jgi:hypothetical protein